MEMTDLTEQVSKLVQLLIKINMIISLLHNTITGVVICAHKTT